MSTPNYGSPLRFRAFLAGRRQRHRVATQKAFARLGEHAGKCEEGCRLNPVVADIHPACVVGTTLDRIATRTADEYKDRCRTYMSAQTNGLFR